MRSVKFILFRILFPLAISGAAIYFSLRHTKVSEVVAAMAAADPLRIALYVCVLLCIHLLRTVRWGILLEPLGHVGFKRLNSASAVGFMLLMLLPLRLGEFARPLLIARPPPGGGQPLRRSGAMASIVVERIVDGIAIGILGVVSLRLLGTSATGKYVEFARSASWLVAAGFFALCVGLVLAVLFRERAIALIGRLLQPISPRIAGKARSMLDAFIGAVHVGSGWKLLAFFVLTAVYWALTAYGLGLVADAFGFTNLTPLMLAVILTIQVVGVMVPAGPGMVGTMQFFTQAGLSLFVLDGFSARGAAYANTIWLLQFGEQVVLGVSFLLVGHVSLKGLFGTQAIEEEAPAATVLEQRGSAP
jgi:glycosyltransferase 2 family protein